MQTTALLTGRLTPLVYFVCYGFYILLSRLFLLFLLLFTKFKTLLKNLRMDQHTDALTPSPEPAGLEHTAEILWQDIHPA